MVSTAADALAWARAGGPGGAVVVADYQLAARGRGGTPWPDETERGLGFSMVLRPGLPPGEEGWLYCAVGCGLLELMGEHAVARWPDEVVADDRVGMVGIEPGDDWAVANVMLPGAGSPRGPLLAEAIAAIERVCGDDRYAIRDDYERRCETIGRRVRARLIPLGPTGRAVSGVAKGVLTDGALWIEVPEGGRAGVRPAELGVLEVLD